ncbi:FAD-dependent monooxygenase [Spirillospora sp. NPDC049652]
MTDEAEVLVVGGGYAGLASALFLSHQGVRCLLVDKHPDVSPLGRARGINMRTMELYRPLGLEKALLEAGRPFDSETGVVRCERLTGEWHWILDHQTPRALPDLTPGVFGMADQSSVEPILIDAARERGAAIRFGAELLSADQDAEGVTARILDHASGARSTVRARYLIAADGYRSGIRRRLGIARPGPGVTEHWISFIVDADLSEVVTRRALLWIVVNPEVGTGSLLTQAKPDQWVVSVTYDPARQSPADFTPDRCAALARAVIGADLPVRVGVITSWEQAVGVADRFRSGRMFLVGDSAHVWPPAGAMGANAAVQDAHNLAWKLAAVLGGRAADGLLDTYEDERRPVASALADLTVRRQRARFGASLGEDDVDDVVCILGQRYNSSAVIDPAHTTVYGGEVERDALPGTRMPHLWLDTDVSTHDLFHDAFVVLTDTDEWLRAAASVNLRAHRAPVRGCILVRPDGYVAWRASGPVADPAAELDGALRRVLGVKP